MVDTVTMVMADFHTVAWVDIHMVDMVEDTATVVASVAWVDIHTVDSVEAMVMDGNH
jgi:hypothetical protein